MTESGFERRILGIDPGTNFLGYAVIAIPSGGKKPHLVVSGVVDLKKITDPYLKLQKIFNRVLQVIEEYIPDELAIEAPFYDKNAQSMLKLGRAQGVAMAAALHRGVPVCEYAPRKVKMSITGVGSASKEQIATLLKNYMTIHTTTEMLDETDAIAIAYCHYLQTSTPLAGDLGHGSTSKSWSEFIKNNPNRVK